MNQEQSQSESIIGLENESAQYQQQDDQDDDDDDDDDDQEEYEDQYNQSNQSHAQGGKKIEISTITLNPTQKNGSQSLKISINLGGSSNQQSAAVQQNQKSQCQSNKLQYIQRMTSRQTRRTQTQNEAIFTGKVKQRPQRKNRQSDDQNQAQRKLQKRIQNKKLMQEAKKAELKKILESISKKSQPKKARKQQTQKQKAQKYSNKLSSLHPIQKRINFERHVISREKNTITFPVELPPALRQLQPLIQRTGNLYGRVCYICQKDAKYYHKEGFSSCSLKCYREIKQENQQ